MASPEYEVMVKPQYSLPCLFPNVDPVGPQFAPPSSLPRGFRPLLHSSIW
jgi:hypothetical protein